MSRATLLKTAKITIGIELVLILTVGTILLARGTAEDAPEPVAEAGPADPSADKPLRTLLDEDLESYPPGSVIAGREPDLGRADGWHGSLRPFKPRGAEALGADPIANGVTIQVVEEQGNRLLRFKGRNGGEPDIFLCRVLRSFEPVEMAKVHPPVVVQSVKLRLNKPTGNGNIHISIKHPTGGGQPPALVAIDPKNLGAVAFSRAERPGGEKRIQTPLLEKDKIVVGHWYKVILVAYLADVGSKRAQTFDVMIIDLDDPAVHGSAEDLYFNTDSDSLGYVQLYTSGTLPSDMDFDVDDIQVGVRSEP